MINESNSDPRDAVKDILYSLKNIFGRYTRTARKKGWDAIQTGKGKSQVDKLLNNPSAPIVGSARLLGIEESQHSKPLVSFNEWLRRKNK